LVKSAIIVREELQTKSPDLERTLSNWAKNFQQKGRPLSNDIIWDKARFYAEAVGSNESCMILDGDGWLEKFKQKNKLLGVRPLKTSISESRSGFKSQTPRISPISVTPPLSPVRSHNDHPSAGAHSKE
jgi:hypothetical protein